MADSEKNKININ